MVFFILWWQSQQKPTKVPHEYKFKVLEWQKNVAETSYLDFRFLLRSNVENLKSELVALITGLNMAKYFQLSWMVGTLTGMF